MLEIHSPHLYIAVFLLPLAEFGGFLAPEAVREPVEARFQQGADEKAAYQEQLVQNFVVEVHL